jgi:hypothetical protein
MLSTSHEELHWYPIFFLNQTPTMSLILTSYWPCSVEGESPAMLAHVARIASCRFATSVRHPAGFLRLQPSPVRRHGASDGGRLNELHAIADDELPGGSNVTAEVNIGCGNACGGDIVYSAQPGELHRT